MREGHLEICNQVAELCVDGLFAEVDISFRACFFSAWGGQFKPGMGATALKSGLTLTITAPAIGAPRRPMADGRDWGLSAIIIARTTASSPDKILPLVFSVDD